MKWELSSTGWLVDMLIVLLSEVSDIGRLHLYIDGWDVYRLPGLWLIDPFALLT